MHDAPLETLLAHILSTVPAAGLEAYRGRKILIPAPSYQFLTPDGKIDHARREQALAMLEALGAVPSLMSGALCQEGRFAGSDEMRAADLEAALLDEEADLVMALRGGYGMVRVLPLLDWEAIGRARLPMTGYSDFTAFNLALLAKTGRPSWHGAMLGSFAEPEPYLIERFAAVFGANPGPVAWQTDPELLGSITGDARFSGMLWGGNLCLAASLCGTPWMPPAEMTAGGILFLEDVGEAAYRVERMLITLLDAGILARQKAILLGDFAGADRAARFEGDHTVAQAAAYLRKRLPASIPIVTGLPFGHIPLQAALPIGVPAELELAGGRAGLSWSAVP